MGARGGGQRESGLVGLLVVLVVLGALAAVAFASLGGSGGKDPSPAAGLAAQVVPAARADLDDVAGSGEALRTGVAGQAARACTVTARTLATAAQTYQAATGTYPSAPEDLVTAGLLAQAPSAPGYTFGFETSGGQPTGRVLVNGAPADTGCSSPAGG